MAQPKDLKVYVKVIDQHQHLLTTIRVVVPTDAERLLIHEIHARIKDELSGYLGLASVPELYHVEEDHRVLVRTTKTLLESRGNKSQVTLEAEVNIISSPRLEGPRDGAPSEQRPMKQAKLMVRAISATEKRAQDLYEQYTNSYYIVEGEEGRSTEEGGGGGGGGRGLSRYYFCWFMWLTSPHLESTSSESVEDADNSDDDDSADGQDEDGKAEAAPATPGAGPADEVATALSASRTASGNVCGMCAAQHSPSMHTLIT